MREQLKTLILEFKVSLAAWIILNDHYHLLLNADKGPLVSPLIQRLHGAVSRELNQREGTKGRRVWQNFWDTQIRDESGFWRRFNYIHHNSIKHDYVRDMKDYEFSSFQFYWRTQGEDWLADVFRQYPIKDYTDPFDI